MIKALTKLNKVRLLYPFLGTIGMATSDSDFTVSHDGFFGVGYGVYI